MILRPKIKLENHEFAFSYANKSKNLKNMNW